jgi:quercetin dioxygenase-like cupin family protein
VKPSVFAAAAALAAALPGVSSVARPATAAVRQPASHETANILFRRVLPNVPGKTLIAVEVLFPPGAAALPHRHPPSAFVYAYVVSGTLISAVDDDRPRVYRAGDSWQEPPGAHHTVTRNASRTKAAKLLAIFIADRDDSPFVVADPQ